MIPLLPWFDALPRWAKRAIMAAGVLLVLAVAWFTWLHFHDRKVIAAHEAVIDAQVTQKADDATQAADDADAIRRAGMATDQAVTTKAMNDAEAKDPQGAQAAAGPVTRAASDSLRNRAAKAGAASR